MKLSWMFGNSMQAHHLLAAYCVVWAVQGGYFGWTLWKTMQVDRVDGALERDR